MPAPILYVQVDTNRATLTYRAEGIVLAPSSASGKVPPSGTSLRDALEARIGIGPLALSQSPISQSLRAAVQGKQDLQRAAQEAAAEAAGLARKRLLTLFLSRDVRERAAAAAARAEAVAREAADPVILHLVHAGSKGAVATLWERVFLSGLEAVQSRQVWDVVGQAAVDRQRERTTASTSIERTEVRCSEGNPGFLGCDRRVLCFGNANGKPLFLFPTFLMVGTDPATCTVIDLGRLQVEIESVRFHETGVLPTDATRVGSTWKYANRDGGPDRRFVDNCQIPIARYIKLSLSTSTGLRESYMFSNAAAGERFGMALQALVAKLRGLTSRVEAT